MPVLLKGASEVFFESKSKGGLEMNIDKVAIAGVAVVVIAGLFVSPAQAHRKYRPHHKGLPRRVLVRHSHNPIESAKSAAPTQSKSKGFDLLGGTADIVIGTLKIFGNAVDAVFGGKAEPASQMQKNESRNGSSLRRNYRFVPRHPSGSPRWVRERD
jgi:hypothetical protein